MLLQSKKVVELFKKPEGFLYEYTALLPESLKQGLEYLSGIDLTDVVIHYNSSEPKKVKALAYAIGAEIYLAPKKEFLLPHESWHIVQQKQGRVAVTGSVNGLDLNDMPELEKEADIMGALACSMAIALDEGYINFFDLEEKGEIMTPKLEEKTDY